MIHIDCSCCCVLLILLYVEVVVTSGGFHHFDKNKDAVVVVAVVFDTHVVYGGKEAEKVTMMNRHVKCRESVYHTRSSCIVSSLVEGRR